MEQDHYAVLGVAPTAEQAAIRSAYRALMRRYHPDADASDEAAGQARAINQAYAVLGDPEKRARYDGSLGSRSSLSFEPSAEKTTGGRKSRAGPFVATGVALLAAGMVAFAIMPPTDPFPVFEPEHRIQPAGRSAPAHPVDARPSDSGVEKARPEVLPPVTPTVQFPEPEPLEPMTVDRATPAYASDGDPPARAGTAMAAKGKLVTAASVALPIADPVRRASASPPCSSAARRTDRLVCADKNLASLDRQLTLLYRQSYSEADDGKRAALLGTRQRFNDRRDACESSNCLTTAYVVRLKEISDIMAGRLQP